MNDTPVLSRCHYRVTKSIVVGGNDLTLIQISKISKICVIYEKITNMQSMQLHYTQKGQGLDIHLVL